MKVLITGGEGQLGYHFNREITDCQVYSLGKRELDITVIDRVFEIITNLSPDIVIHSAAYTDVDGCESNETKAYLVNALGTRNIALACKQVGARMVYISTDFVFAGTKSSPYLPSDLPNPLNIYGLTKLAGERNVESILDEYFIIRTSWLYGDRGKNFVKTMLRLAKDKDVIKVVNDQIGSPTYAKDLAQIINKLMRTPYFGLYQFSNIGEVSWYDFAKGIFLIKHLDIDVQPISSVELGRPAKRPGYSVMSTIDIQQVLGITPRSYTEALRDFLAKVEE